MSFNDDRIKALSEEQTDKLLGKEIFRKRVIEIMCEYVGSVEFMEKVQKYAGWEMDKRVFRSVKYWFIVVISAIITSGIGFAIAYWWPIKK